MSYPSRNLGANITESSVDCGGMAYEVSEGHNISSWAQNYFCDVLAKNVIAIFHCFKNFPKVKLKNNGLDSLMEILR